ncbi:putative efflux system component YknX [Desulfosporosinus acididurans]|uniref:Putative efflux system component YknX n=1 Tax=Desulfosporosinus acididurans TaxID=476652 RepID=A0A0J1FT05_9FIRM|nr:efflux RND transporter periplasmic adaptor subunit [Desulfosporosinus acididurans]KLU66098.1 putative efflux system component YknX [Desulfosporosinus acididurans]
MKKRLWWGIGIVVVLLAAGGWWFSRNAQSPLKVSAGKVSPISMQEDIYATGSVVPNSRQDVYVLNPGLVSKVTVKAGDSVKTGQVLVGLDQTLANAQVAQAQANVDAAQAGVNAAQGNVTDLKQAQSAVQSSAATAGAAQAGAGTVNISGTGGGNINGNSGSAGLNPASGGSAFPSALSSSGLGSSVHQAEGTLAQSQAALKQAQEALQVAQAQRDQLTYKSSLDGTALEVNVQAGNPAPVQQPLVVIADLKHMNVNMQLNEMDAAKLKMGGKVTVTSKTLGSTSLTGVIAKIAPEAVIQPSAQGNASPTVAVTVRLDQAPVLLKPGYSVTVQAIVATKKNVLAVPLESVFQEGSKNYVYRIQNGLLHKTEVKVGIGNDTDQEITAGLKSGDQIVLNPTNQLSEGQAVTPDLGSDGA